MKWRYQSEAVPYTAADLVIGPIGNLYYTITDRSKTFVVSLSPEGEHHWTTQVRTQDIYDLVQISVDGRYVFLKNDVFDAVSGELLEFDIPMEVNEFIPSIDGRTYLRSGHTIMEWQYSTDGFELLHTEPWQHNAFENFDPISSFVDGNQMIWLFYQGNFSAGYSTQLVWVNLEGEVKASHFISWSSQRLSMSDRENSRIIECGYVETDQALACEAYTPEIDASIWNVKISEIPRYADGFIVGEYVYLQTTDDQVVAAYIGSP